MPVTPPKSTTNSSPPSRYAQLYISIYFLVFNCSITDSIKQTFIKAKLFQIFKIHIESFYIQIQFTLSKPVCNPKLWSSTEQPLPIQQCKLLVRSLQPHSSFIPTTAPHRRVKTANGHHPTSQRPGRGFCPTAPTCRNAQCRPLGQRTLSGSFGLDQPLSCRSSTTTATAAPPNSPQA